MDKIAEAQKLIGTWQKRQDAEKKKDEEGAKKKKEGLTTMLSNFNNLSEGTYKWNDTAWVNN